MASFTMRQTSRSQLAEYFQKHSVDELLRDLTEELALTQPEQPIKMLHMKLSKMLEEMPEESISAEGNADYAAAAPEVSTERTFGLRMHIEAIGRKGSFVRHFSRRGMQTNEETLESWKRDATATLTEAYTCMTGRVDTSQESPPKIIIAEIRQPKIIIAGAPASGKGTQCEFIVEKFGVVHISTGDALREQVKAGTDLGKLAKGYMDQGGLVPDEVMIGIVKSRLAERDCQERGWLLDGFPRTGVQAKAMEEAGIKADKFVLLNVPDHVLVERCVGRRSDPVTGKIYHLKFNPPPQDPVIQARLVQRSDDTEEAMKKRIEQYKGNVESIKGFYKSLTREFDGVSDKHALARSVGDFISGKEVGTTPPKIIIAGAPASGKGTQCEFIVEKFGVVHISTGDALREQVKAGTDLGKLAKGYMDQGGLVPDEVMIGIVKSRLAERDCQERGWLLDGFPRTGVQAKAMEEAGIKADKFVLLNVPDHVLVERCVGRRSDPVTGKIYHLKFNPPPQDPVIQARLVQRSDDTEEAMKRRIEQYKGNVESIKGFYKSLTREFDGVSDKHALARSVGDFISGKEVGTTPPKIIIAGAPASGKGTQCEFIVEKFGVVHISTGDALREQVKAGTDLGKLAKGYMDQGGLVPDEVMIGIVKSRLAERDCQERGWLLDGFPRTGVQAKAMEEAGIKADKFVLLNVPDHVLVERCVGRRSDPVTGKIYHLKFNPPPQDPAIQARLVQRSDDTEEAMKKRIEQYKGNVESIKGFYKSLTREFDGVSDKHALARSVGDFISGKEVGTTPPKIIIAGAPASGKGTQCEFIVEKFGVVHISTGDALREQVKAGTDLGKLAKGYMDQGGLVPDEVMIGIVKSRLAERDCQERGWLLDGFPRTGVQAKAMEEAGIKADKFVLLNVPDHVLVERCVGRRSDPVTGKIYHLKFNPPPQDPVIQARLVQRSDDTEEAMKRRIEQYKGNVESIKGFYKSLTREFDGVSDKHALARSVGDFISGKEVGTTPPKIIIAGAPASGKGTQCEFIVEKFGVVHISTGDALREQVKAGTDLGKLAKGYMDQGGLVPDEVMIGIVKSRLAERDCQERGWLLDGFPRTGVQAKAMEEAGIKADKFVLLNVPDHVLVERCVGRRSDPVTGKIYHLKFNPPPQDPAIQARLVQRSDDTEEAMKKRIEQYKGNVESIKGFYKSLTREFDGVSDKHALARSVGDFISGKEGAGTSGPNVESLLDEIAALRSEIAELRDVQSLKDGRHSAPPRTPGGKDYPQHESGYSTSIKIEKFSMQAVAVSPSPVPTKQSGGAFFHRVTSYRKDGGNKKGTLKRVYAGNSEGCRLRIISFNDAHDLSNLACFDSIVREHRDDNTLVIIPGDIIGNNLVGLMDRGSSIIQALNQIGVDYVCFGASEAHVPPDELQKRVDEFQGKWINSNMPDWTGLPEYDIVEVRGQGGKTRKVGLIGILHTTAESGNNAFGGAWKSEKSAEETCLRLKKKLVEEHACDVVIPLTNQSLKRDMALAKSDLGLPLIIGGGDPEPHVEEFYVHTSAGQRSVAIVKTGLGHNMAAIIDLHWFDDNNFDDVDDNRPDSRIPQVHIEKVLLNDYVPNPELAEKGEKAQKNAQVVGEKIPLCHIVDTLLPLSSKGVRRQQTTVGSLICNLCRAALGCDGAAIPGACFRSDKVYPSDKKTWTYNDLKKEMPADCPLTIIQISGSVLQNIVAYSRQTSRGEQPQDWGGFFQLDAGMIWNYEKELLTHVAGQELLPDESYKICVLHDSVMGVYRNQALIDWANSQDHLYWANIFEHPAKDVILNYSIASMFANSLDRDNDGMVSVDELKRLMDHEWVSRNEVKSFLASSMGGEPPEFLVDNVMNLMDINKDGRVSREEFVQYLRVFNKMTQLKEASHCCSMRIISVNDVYEIINFPSLHNLICDHKTDNTFVMLPGDFVAPSLLSSLDKGRGMIDMMNRVGGTGVDFVCFGNHECDIPLPELKKRISEFKGKWINSNMPDWNPPLPEYAIFEIKSDGQTKKIGVLGLNTIDKNLYMKGAFGGAIETALPIVETAERLAKKLYQEEKCDLVIPMTHQVMPEDRQFAEKFGDLFPIIIAAHDHDPYLETVNGATIVKTGADATNAAIIDIIWHDNSKLNRFGLPVPEVKVELLETKLYPPDPALVEVMKGHLKAVDELEAAYLAPVNTAILDDGKLYSTKMRRAPTPIGVMLTSLVRDGIRSAALSYEACDGVMLDAGCLRRNFEYPEGYTVFTFGDLKKEIPFPSEVVVVAMTGQVVVEAVRASRLRAYNSPPEDWGGYLQIDDGFKWDSASNTVTHINGQPIDLGKTYRISCLYLSLSGMNRNQPLIDFGNTIPGDSFTQLGDTGRGAKELIVDCCSRALLAQLGNFDDIDTDGDGVITLDELEGAMTKMLGRTPGAIEIQQLLDSLKQIDPSNTSLDDDSPHITKDIFGLAMRAQMVSGAASGNRRYSFSGDDADLG